MSKLRYFAAEDGAELAYRDEGQGMALLALAGLTRDGRDFDYLAKHLRDKVRFIRLDSRGRGGSSWTGHATYTVAQESRDAIALLDHLEIAKAAIIGSSRGGLLALVMAAAQKDRVTGICFNDVGPALERQGLERISTYVGVEPPYATLEEIADRMPSVMPGFMNVSELRWAQETIRHFVQLDGRVELTYDPDLRVALDIAMSQPPPDIWPLFDNCCGLPLALIRGTNSDLLSAQTASLMLEKRPDLIYAEVPDRGHVPFLDEPEALRCIDQWLDVCRTKA